LQGDKGIEAWKVMESRPDLRKGLNSLKAMSDLLKNPKAKAVFVTDEEFLTKMTKFSETHKTGFWGAGALEARLAQLTKNIDEFQGIDGFDKSVRDAMNNSNPNVQDGFWHGLNATEAMGIKKADVKKFDMEFDELLDCGSPSNPAGCKFDLELNTNTPKYIEFKSYQDAAGIPIKQFKAYISRINNLSEMKYVFNAQKLAANGNDAKAGMKAFLKSNYDEVWAAGQTKGVFNGLKLQNGTIVNSAQRFQTFLSEIDSSNSFFDFVIQK
jgi:hypothetical protein